MLGLLRSTRLLGVENDPGAIYINMAGLMLRRALVEEGERFLELLDGADSWARDGLEAEHHRIRLLYGMGRYAEAWKRARPFREQLTPDLRRSVAETKLATSPCTEEESTWGHGEIST